ncbi:unnamed protein product [Peronospora effusa]|uniref:RxLR effector protein n=2 Tax=Peronospora effusa TaxID=542832 RepID=A0A3M6VMY6_9STRA|nr:hypothetical protein DD238_006785 [Peronospora effusa]CAI5714708.1 unnamed protein product [Peronospora effusa]
MRFNVFFTLFVATFIVSCDSFISAKTYSLNDRTFDSTEVHHLRGNDDIQEERGPPNVVEGIAEQVVSSTTKVFGTKTEMEVLAEEKEKLQKTALELLDRSGRKNIVTKHKVPYEKLALLLLGAAVAGTTGFAVHHLMSAAYDPKTAAPPTTKTTTTGSA